MNYFTKKRSEIGGFSQRAGFWMLLAVGFILSGCSKDNDTKPDGNDPAIVLDCDYFSKNGDIHLKDNPNAPVDYIVTCFAKLGDNNITIDAGVVIEFEQDAGLAMSEKSKIAFNGTKDKPILLTGSEKVKGYWIGIGSFSTYAGNIMAHTTIEYAGGKPIPSWPGKQQGNLCLGRTTSVMAIENSTFKNSLAYGLWADGSAEIKNTIFTGNDWPIRADFEDSDLFDNSNSFEGNTNDYVYMTGGSGDLSNQTFKEINVPYLLDAGDTYGRIKFKKGALTVEPGVELVMKQGSRDLQMFSFSGEGSVRMIGTAEKPIIIRGWEDTPGNWNTIEVNTSNTLNEIAHVEIHNAGNPTSKHNGAIWLRSSSALKVNDVKFVGCYEYAMSFQNITNSNFSSSNLTLDNTPKMFSNWDGAEITIP